MDSSSRVDECWSISPSDPELDIHLLGIEGYSDLSDDNLSTILRSFTESLQQKKSHLNLLEKIECENKNDLIDQTQEALDTLNHDIRCISAELSSRKSSKHSRGDDWPFPTYNEDESESLDLKVVTELVGPSFDEGDKLKFLEQYLSVVHYSRSNPLSSRQLQQIFHLKLKGRALLFFSSLPATLPLKEKVRKLLTVFAYRQHGSDRLVELEEFKREKHERLDSVYLRLTSILDASASLVRPSLRQARNEFFLSQAMFLLSLPGVKARLTKYQTEKTGDGLYVTSSDLLKMALRFEENVIAGRSEEVRLGLKDPFVAVAELPSSTKRTKVTRCESEPHSNSGHKTWGNVQEGRLSPDSWESEGRPSEPKERSDMRRGIEALNKKIDELSEMYNRKLGTGKGPEEIQVNNVIPETAGAQMSPNPTMTQMWEKMLRPFLEAQWNFYSSYDYGKGPHPPMGTQGVQYEKWGSRFRKESLPGRGGWSDNMSRAPPEQRNWYNRSGTPDNSRNRFQDVRFGGFRGTQPTKKRLRFSEWLQSDKARHTGSRMDQGGDNGNPMTPPGNRNGTTNLTDGGLVEDHQDRVFDTQRIGKGGTKRSQPGDPKEVHDRNGEKGEDARPPGRTHQSSFRNITSPPSN